MSSQTRAEIIAERERIAKAGADFFQNGDFDNWESPTGRVFDDLGNGWKVGYDLMVHIIGAGLMKKEKVFNYEV
jgi:hypothetical protein